MKHFLLMGTVFCLLPYAARAEEAGNDPSHLSSSQHSFSTTQYHAGSDTSDTSPSSHAVYNPEKIFERASIEARMKDPAIRRTESAEDLLKQARILADSRYRDSGDGDTLNKGDLFNDAVEELLDARQSTIADECDAWVSKKQDAMTNLQQELEDGVKQEVEKRMPTDEDPSQSDPLEEEDKDLSQSDLLEEDIGDATQHLLQTLRRQGYKGNLQDTENALSGLEAVGGLTEFLNKAITKDTKPTQSGDMHSQPSQ